MKKTYKMGLIGLLVGLMTAPWPVASAVSGHYTDLLPNPTSAPGIEAGTLYYNGYDWQVATLGVSQTPGDALSRSQMTVYQSTGVARITNTLVGSTLTVDSAGFVGSTTFPAAWVKPGRSFRVDMRGYYGTPPLAGTWEWALKLGTTTVLTTGPLTAPVNVSTQPFSASMFATVFSSGTSGTVSSSFDIRVTTSALTNGNAGNIVSFSTQTFTPTTVDLTSQLNIVPFFDWGTATTGGILNVTNLIIEFLN
jgi:hypothetical protein